MNDRKLKQLFTLARKQAAPAPPADFATDVLRALRREPSVAAQLPGADDRQIDLAGEHGRELRPC
jgi:hypothetical protein